MRFNRRMTTHNRTATARTARRVSETAEREFEQVEELPIIAHMTVPAFMRRITSKWHFDDITRFGDKVGRAAEALQLSYLTTFDGQLGTIRVFPYPLLERVYRVMSGAHPNWPKIVDADPPTLDDVSRVSRETLLAHERVATHLRVVLDAAEDDGVRASIVDVLDWLERDCAKLRERLPAPVEPARS
jgi:hypothetical protein